MPITWTDAEIAELRAAIASGVLTVKYAGPPAREVTYQSLREMRDLLSEMTRQGRPTSRRVAWRKGFRDGC